MADNGLRPPKPLEVSSQAPDKWDDWLQSYNWYATAVQIHKKAPEVQVAKLMTVIGPEVQSIYKTFARTEEERKHVEVVKKKFKEYFTPRTNLAYERYRFNKMRQEGESFMEFLTAARLQAKKCKFGDLTDELLRDRLIVGITNDDVREKLLADPAIDLEKTVHMCKGSEQATKQLKEITTKDAEAKLLDALETKTKKKWPSKGKARTEEPQQRQCQYCGGTHRRKECPAYGKKCITCNKMGHFAAVCRSRKQKEVHC
ncbi:uncharacterized protein LOC144149087 [Haemaphysalis longicornis]